jgi:alpha-tubulin suppressor-like RCC1 family protein
VCGNLENGKLGLGNSWREGVILNFTQIPNLHGAKYVSCGPNHMMAICEGPKQQSILYGWGLNDRG